MPPADFSPGMSETSSPKRSSASPAGPSTSQIRSPAAIAARIVVTLASAPSAPGICAALERRQHPVAGEAQGEELRRDLAEAVARLGVARARLVGEQRVREAVRAPAEALAAEPDRHALEHQRRQPDAPAAVDRPDLRARLEPDVVEEDLVEVRLAGDLAQRAHRHARRRPSGRRTSSGPCAWARRGWCARAAGRTPRAARWSSTPSGPRAARSRRPAAWRASGCRRGRSRRPARRRAGTRPRRRSASGRGGAASAPRSRARSASGRACRRR